MVPGNPLRERSFLARPRGYYGAKVILLIKSIGFNSSFFKFLGKPIAALNV
jgi:hypothetical protein